MNRSFFFLVILLALSVVIYSADRTMTISSGKVKLTIDAAGGGAPAGIWFDKNGDGNFSHDELILDTGHRQGLILKVVEIPWKISGVKLEEGMIPADECVAGRLPLPNESWYSGESYQLTAVIDSMWKVSDNRLVVLARFLGAGIWKYRLEWELAETGIIKGRFQFLNKPQEIRHSEILELGADFRFHYQSEKSFLTRAVHAGIDKRIWEMPAGFFRWWYRIESLYVPNKTRYGFNHFDEIPWPDYDLVSLVQTSDSDCQLWKAIDWDVGKITQWYGQKARGWLQVEDREWGMGFGIEKMADQPSMSLNSHLDTGDLTAALQIRFVTSQTSRQNPQIEESDNIYQPFSFFLVPQNGRWSEKSAIILDELGNPSLPIVETEPNPQDVKFLRPENLPKFSPNDKIVRFKIDEPAGIERKLWPFSGGIPLKKGQIYSPDNLNLVDSQGKTIPVQTEILAYWPDKSIKWALVDAQVDLPKNTGALFLLTTDKKSTSLAQRVSAVETEMGVRVNTGVLAFELDRQGSGFIDRA